MRSKRQCVLVAGFEDESVSILQHAWCQSGLRLPLTFVRTGKEAIDYLKGAEVLSQEVHPAPAVLLLALKSASPAPQAHTLDLSYHEVADINVEPWDGASSLDLLCWVRKRRRSHDLVVIVSSLDWKQWELKRAYALGADCCLSSSHRFAEVIYRLKRLENFWFGPPSQPTANLASLRRVAEAEP